MTFKLQLREDRPATIEEHTKLCEEVARLRARLKSVSATLRVWEGYGDMSTTLCGDLADDIDEDLRR